MEKMTLESVPLPETQRRRPHSSAAVLRPAGVLGKWLRSSQDSGRNER